MLNPIKIALDLELEQPNSNRQVTDSVLLEEKIIQVGYCIFNADTGEFLKEFCKEVNIGVPLSTFIKNLTGITDEQISKGITLLEIINELHADALLFNVDRKILTWGGGDQEAIIKELPKDYPWKFGRSSFNVKHLYQLYRDIKNQKVSSGLKKSINRMGITFEGSAHNALVDAKNTAKIYMELIKKFNKE